MISSAPASTAKPAAQTKQTAAAPVQKAAAVNTSAEYTTYTVKSGDSLYLIAKRYPGVSAQNIMDFNGIGSNIKPGMTLKIPKL